MKKNYLRTACVIVSFFSLQGVAQDTAKNGLPSWAMGGFERPSSVNPVIKPNEHTLFSDELMNKSVAWEAYYTFNPAAAVKGNQVVVLYRAEDKTGTVIGTRTSRIGYAASSDGLMFERRPTPVLFPAKDAQQTYEWPGGCEDPRVAVTEDGTYVMMYTLWNRKIPRIGVATSKDLVNWSKHGPAFLKAYSGKFCDRPHKSASVITEMKNGKQVIAKIDGKYWMYWGEDHVYAATSTNLVDWIPVVDKAGNLLQLMSPRNGFFDSHLTECGPPAIITDDGILLLYNGKNRSDENRDMQLPANTYAAGQALFDKKNPTKFVTRLDKPFFRPMKPFEKSGQYEAGTVFIEGLVYFKNKWFLYYGCADSFVGVAVYDPSQPAMPDPYP